MLPFYHPTNVLIVDDDPVFLDSFAYRYEGRFLCQTNNSPNEASTQLKQHFGGATPEPLSDPISSVPGTSWWKNENRPLLQDLAAIQNIARQEKRCDCVSVVIVDFAMPSMTGVEFCRKIKDLPIKRLLLTGKTGNTTAVDAFNEGLIDCFVVKQDPQIATRLPLEIEKLQRAFFADLSAPVMAPGSKLQEMAFLDDTTFEARFEELRSKYSVIEYYLSTLPTGILMIDAQGRRTSVIVYDEDMMRASYETAFAVAAPQELLEQIKTRSVVVAFPTSTGLYEPQHAVDWAQYTHTAQLIGDNASWWMAEVPAPAFASTV